MILGKLRMAVGWAVAAIAVSLWLLSCTYTPDQKFVTPIQPPPSHIVATVDITSPDLGDPFPLDWLTVFSLRVGSDKPIRQVGVKVNGRQVDPGNPAGPVFPNDSKEVRFQLNPNDFPDGVHEVVVTISLDTQSGSLLNKLGGEYYLLEKKFNISVNRALPNLTPFTVGMENGFMTLRWTVPNERKLDYEISTYYLIPGGPNFIDRKIFSNESGTVYVDSGFVGGNVRYHVAASNFANRNFYPAVEKKLSPVKFLFQTDANKAGTISWLQTVPHAIVTLVNSEGSRTVPITQEVLLADTLFLGDKRTYRVFLHRNGYAKQTFDTTISISSHPGLPVFRDVKMLPAQSKLMVMGQSNTYRLSIPSMTREDSLSRHTAGSPALQLVVSENAQHGVYMHPNGGPVLINPLNFSQRQSFAPYVLDPFGVGRVILTNGLSSVSNGGLLGLSFLYNGATTGAVADITADLNVDPYAGVIWKDSANAAMPVFSPNGQYFIIKSRTRPFDLVYHKNGSSWDSLGQMPTGAKFFRGGSSTEVVSIGSAFVDVFDVGPPPDASGNFHSLRSLNYMSFFGGQNVVQTNYDPVSQSFYVETRDARNYSTLFIYSITSFSRFAKAKAFTPPSVPNTVKHIYTGGFHFLSTGFVESIP